MSMFNGDYSNSGTEWSPKGGRSGYRGGNSGGWGRGRGRGSGGRWASPGGGRGPYDHPRPPPLHSREGVWGTGDRRHSDSLAPGSSLVDGSSSNRHSSGNSGGSASSYRRGGGGNGSGEGGEGGASSSPSTGGKKRTPESVNSNDSSSNSGNYKRQRHHRGSPSGEGDGGERKVVSARGDGDASKKSSGSSSSNNNNDNSNYHSNHMKWNKLSKRKNGSRGKGGHNGQKGEENIVLQRREAKLKELQRLDNRKKAAVAAGEALAKDVQRNRMEQEEIAIQIDAVKRFLALYDSTFASSEDLSTARTQKPPPSANAGTAADGDSEVARLPPPSVLPPGTLKTPSPPPPRASPPMPTAYVRAPSPAIPVPLEQSPFGSLSPSASRPRSEPSARGRGGSSARGRAPGSRSSLVVAGASITVGDRNPNDLANAGSARAGIVPGLGLGVGAGAAVEAVSKGAKKGSGRLAGSFRKPGGNSSSSSSDDDDAGGVPGVGGNGNISSLYGYIMSMPPSGGGTGARAGALAVPDWSASNPQACEADVEVFPNRVLSDGTDGARSSGNGGPTRGKEVNIGSFHILKQLMFRTTRTKRARSMAFNPAVPGLFAVCSADLSVDLWQYTRKNNELERVWTRQEATPIGGAHMAWNPSGTHLAIGHTGANLVNQWAATIVGRGDAFKGMKLRSDKHTKPASAVAWVTPSKNNQDHLVTGGEDGRVVIWTRVLDATSDLHKVAVLHCKHTSGVKSTCCPSISPTVVSGGADGRLVSFSIETASVEWEEPLLVSNTYHPIVNELLEFPDNPRCLLVSAVDTARSHSMFTMDTREKISLIHTARRMTWKRKDEKRPFSSLVYPSISPCGRYVACAGDWNGCFHLWDVRSGRAEPMQSVLVNSLARVGHTAWHPDPEARAIMSLSNSQMAKNFALHLHAGVRS